MDSTLLKLSVGALIKSLTVISLSIVMAACSSGSDSQDPIVSPREPLSAISLSFTVQTDALYSGQLNSENGLGDLQYSLLMLPSKGVTSVDASGAFEYVPEVGFSGQDRFLFGVVDSEGRSSTAQVFILVNGVNQAPVPQPLLLPVNGAEYKSAQLIATDANGDSLLFTLDSNSAFGAALVTSGGLFSYTIHQAIEGSEIEELTYTVSDGELTSTGVILLLLSDSNTSIVFEKDLTEVSADQRIAYSDVININNISDRSIELALAYAPDWYESELIFEVPAGDSYALPISLNASELPAGIYNDNLYFFTNEGDDQIVSHSVSFNVIDITPPANINDLVVASGTLYDQAQLTFTAVADNGNQGASVAGYDVRYSNVPITEANWNDAIQVDSIGDVSVPGLQQSLQVSGLVSNTNIYIAVKVFDISGFLSGLSNNVTYKTLTPPVANITPLKRSFSVNEGDKTSFDITVSNTGSTPLEYQATIVRNIAHLPLKAQLTNRKVSMPKFTARDVEKSGGRIIVKRNAVMDSVMGFSNTLHSYQLSTDHYIQKLDLQVVSNAAKTHQESADLINYLNTLPEVAYAEPDYKLRAFSTPNDASFSEQWALNNEGQTGGVDDADIDALEVWDRYIDGSNIIVAVIDSGVNYNHEDLANNMWINADEIAGNGIDDDNNGYVDDVHGYDFANNDGDPMDDDDHGTHCAGIIGAQANNDVGIAGAVHNAQIMALKFLGRSGGDASDAVEAIIYAVDNGATILNNSWGGGPFSQALLDAITYAEQNDVMFIAAAGNDSSNNDTFENYPSNYDVSNVIAVASTDHLDNMSSFSNYGLTTVDLGAPGTDILSTVSDGGYESFSGTSMATPYVAGAAVMIRSQFPQLSAADVKDILLTTVDLVPSLDGKTVTGGRLNMNAAIEEASARSPNLVSLNGVLSGRVQAGATITIPVEVDATDVAPDFYEYEIHFDLNDPASPQINMNLDITVNFDAQAPADVVDLAVVSQTSNSITVEWTNTGDDGFVGNASEIELAYSLLPITQSNWDAATKISGITPDTSGEIQQAVVANLLSGTAYYIALKVMDNSGQYSGVSNIANTTTNVGAVLSAPSNIAPLELAIGESEVVIMTLENIGDEILSYSLNANLSDNQVTNQVNSAQLNTADKSTHIKKGEQDYRMGEVQAQSSGGPDVFGYSWKDSDSAGVVYDWQDISAIGIPMEFTLDSIRGGFDLGFTFDFYGQSYSQVFVSSHGFISFESFSVSQSWTNQPIPSVDSYNNIIAWAWDDLSPKAGYTAHYLAEDGKFTIQFKNYGEFSDSGLVSAQIILYSTGRIKLQYKSFINGFDVNSATVGIENADGTDGLQIVFNAAYLKDELAVEFSAGPQWLTLSQTQGELAVGEAVEIEIGVDASDLILGDYEAELLINSNDIATPSVMIPLQLEVVEPVVPVVN